MKYIMLSVALLFSSSAHCMSFSRSPIKLDDIKNNPAISALSATAVVLTGCVVGLTIKLSRLSKKFDTKFAPAESRSRFRVVGENEPNEQTFATLQTDLSEVKSCVEKINKFVGGSMSGEKTVADIIREHLEPVSSALLEDADLFRRLRALENKPSQTQTALGNSESERLKILEGRFDRMNSTESITGSTLLAKDVSSLKEHMVRKSELSKLVGEVMNDVLQETVTAKMEEEIPQIEQRLVQGVEDRIRAMAPQLSLVDEFVKNYHMHEQAIDDKINTLSKNFVTKEEFAKDKETFVTKSLLDKYLTKSDFETSRAALIAGINYNTDFSKQLYTLIEATGTDEAYSGAGKMFKAWQTKNKAPQL